jgi:preprotein translocase subunit SecE
MGFISKIGNGFKSVGNFFRDSWTELKKVRWPNRKELVNYTLVVIATVVFISVFFAVVDLGISEILRMVLG